MSVEAMQFNLPHSSTISPALTNPMNSGTPAVMPPLQIQRPSSVSDGNESSPSNPNSLPKITPEYLQELLKDKRVLQNFPNFFNHLDKILDVEIGRARSQLFNFNGTRQADDELPDGEGEVVTIQEKVYIPVKDNPSYNFVGRLLGPRGMTAKQLETDLDCKIMVRGKGSMRDKRKEDQNRGKPNWEHLAEDLHVLICVEDHQNRADLKIKRAADAIKIFLEQAVKMPDSEDKLKQMQLMEVAMLNEANKAPSLLPGTSGALTLGPPFFRLPAPHPGAGSPLMLGPAPGSRLPMGAPQHLGHGAQLLSPDPTAHLLNYPMVSAADYSYLLAAQAGSGLMPGPHCSDPIAAAAAAAAAAATSAAAAGFPGGLEFSQSGAMKVRHAGGANVRSHPYSRPAA